MMKKSFFVLGMLGVFCLPLLGSAVSLDEILDKDFNDPSLRSLFSIFRGSEVLTDEQLMDLVQSEQLTNLRTLDLRNQENLTDAHIIALAGNPTFSRLLQLELSNCPQISDASIEALRASEHIGKVRDLPRESGRYGCPGTDLHVAVTDTSVTQELRRRRIENRPFRIEYQPPNPQRSWPPTNEGVKFIVLSY